MLFSREPLFVTFAVFTAALFSVVTVVGVASNAIVTVAVLGEKKLRCASINLLLANLVRGSDDNEFRKDPI